MTKIHRVVVYFLFVISQNLNIAGRIEFSVMPGLISGQKVPERSEGHTAWRRGAWEGSNLHMPRTEIWVNCKYFKTGARILKKIIGCLKSSADLLENSYLKFNLGFIQRQSQHQFPLYQELTSVCGYLLIAKNGQVLCNCLKLKMYLFFNSFLLFTLMARRISVCLVQIKPHHPLSWREIRKLDKGFGVTCHHSLITWVHFCNVSTSVPKYLILGPNFHQFSIIPYYLIIPPF